MIEGFGIAKNESEIAIYAGMVTSAFTFAEFSAVRQYSLPLLTLQDTDLMFFRPSYGVD